jgi:hypothetical protein
MKSIKYIFLGIGVAAAALVAVVMQSRPVLASEQVVPPATRSGSFLGEEFGLGDTDWVEDFPEEAGEGSPVRPGKVAICHKGMTILVSQTAVANHLAHGDTLGPCGPTETVYTIVCHGGKALVVTLVEAAGHVGHGDTLGLCAGDTGAIMCNGKENVAVAQADVKKKQDEGWTLGPCKGKEAVAMCREGKTIVVSKDKVDAHLKAGDTLGACPKK